MQWVTSVSHAQIVENQNIATATLLLWSKKKISFLGLNDGNKLGYYRLANRRDS